MKKIILLVILVLNFLLAPCFASAQEVSVDYAPYIKYLQNKIKSNWSPPKGRHSKRVIALFKLSREGTLQEVKIKESSGNEDVDKSALKAINRSAPFNPFPKESKEKSLDIQFTFDYNVFMDSTEKNSCHNVNEVYQAPAEYREYKKLKGYYKYKHQIDSILSHNLPKNIGLGAQSAVISFMVDKNGKVEAVSIAKSSGTPKYDEAVVSFIQKSCFSAIPPTINSESLAFYYKVQSKKKAVPVGPCIGFGALSGLLFLMIASLI